jgi:hypothetical protein
MTFCWSIGDFVFPHFQLSATTISLFLFLAVKNYISDATLMPPA